MNNFKKNDSNKIMMSLVEPMFVEGVAEVLTFGAKKYERDNWKQLEYKDLYRLKDSLLRHTYAYLDGEYFDEESTLEHLKHMATNIMMILYHEDKKISEDYNDWK